MKEIGITWLLNNSESCFFKEAVAQAASFIPKVIMQMFVLLLK